jgi:hypothetical protein
LDLTTTLCPFYLPPTPSPVIPSFPPSSFHLNPNNYAFSTLRFFPQTPSTTFPSFSPSFSPEP